MHGAVAVSAELSGLEILSGSEFLTEYRFNTQQAAHFFCSQCGIYTFHQRRSNPQQYGINVACLEGVSPFDFATVEVVDGVNHPRDGGGVAGFVDNRIVRGQRPGIAPVAIQRLADACIRRPQRIEQLGGGARHQIAGDNLRFCRLQLRNNIGLL